MVNLIFADSLFSASGAEARPKLFVDDHKWSVELRLPGHAERALLTVDDAKELHQWLGVWLEEFIDQGKRRGDGGAQ